MTIKSTTTFGSVAQGCHATENGAINNVRHNTESHFDKLLAVIFDSATMQELVGSNDLSCMLNTIANISNYRGR